MQITTGYYYHYKHDPSGPVNNYAYEVLGVGCHTEMDEHSADRYFVVYRPLYESGFYKEDKMFALRPYSMFIEMVAVNGSDTPRFRKITDDLILDQLTRLRVQMYNA